MGGCCLMCFKKYLFFIILIKKYILLNGMISNAFESFLFF